MAVDILGNKIDDTIGYVSDVEAARMKAAREARMANNLISQPNIVSSTTQLRDQDNANKLDAQNLLQSILGESATSDGLINNLYGMVGMTGETENERLLREMQRSIGLTTPEDIQQISAAGAAAESAYAPLIQEAEAAKAQGMPKATIAAGERGGFMNTQFAGVGALLPTQGGDFAGTGGILNQIKSEYDANISNLKAQARNARLVAEQAYREYLRTGKMENYNVMKDAVNLEREKQAEALRRAGELVNMVRNYQNIQQARISFEQGQEDKVKTEAANMLNYYSENFGSDYLAQNKEVVSNLLEQSGYRTDDIDEFIKSIKEKEEQAIINGLPKPELRTVDGSLYQISYDENGNIKTDLLIGKRTTSSTSSSGGGFTSQEKRRLEQAGLLNADRQEQLDFLYGSGGGDDFNNARIIIMDNPDASITELRNGIRENTNLNESEIKGIIDEFVSSGQIKETLPEKLNISAAETIFNSVRSVWSSRSKEKEKAKNEIDNANYWTDPETGIEYKLTDNVKSSIKRLIDNL